MAKLDKVDDAYRELSQSDEAFRILASWLLSQKKLDRLGGLVAVHRERSPKDPWAPYYAGLVAVQDNRTDEGIRQLRAALELASDEQTRIAIRYRVVSEMFDAGQALEAYAQLEPKDDVFRELANAAINKKQPDLLRKLIDARKPDEPSAAAIDDWEMQLAYLKQDYAATIEIARRLRGANRDSKDINLISAHDHLIRSLLHLKQFAAAAREIDQLNKDEADPTWFRTLLFAAQGDVAQTSANLEKHVADGYEIWEFYEDNILGPALRSDALKALREKYPEPKDEKPAPKEDYQDQQSTPPF